MRLGRLLVGSCLVACVACGLAFAPGDYGESGGGVATPDGDAAPDVTSLPDTAASDAPAAVTRILLFAGRRDPVQGEPSGMNVAETMRTTLSAAGELGPWTFDAPPPQSTPWSRAVVAGETLLLQSPSVFLTADVAGDRIGATWKALPAKGPPEGFMRPWFVTDAGLTVAGGEHTGAFTKNVYTAVIFADGGVDDWEQSTSSTLVKPRGDVTLLRHVDFLYAIGGRDNGSPTAPGRDEIEVARYAADGTLGAFAATTELVNPGADAASFGVFLPIVAAGNGYLFVLGGQTNAAGSSTSDVALAAKIDEATGQLGAWIALPKLPAPMNGAAAVVANDTLLVFGGNLGSSSSDAVLALSIQANGFGTEWKKIGSLPGPRTGLAAVVY